MTFRGVAAEVGCPELRAHSKKPRERVERERTPPHPASADKHPNLVSDLRLAGWVHDVFQF